MYRYLLAPVTTDAQGTRAPTVPATATGWVTVADLGARLLLKVNVPDGTAKTATTIADITVEDVPAADGNPSQRRQVDVSAEPLTLAQRSSIKQMLTAAGLSVAQFDGDTIDDRAKLLRYILRRLAQRQDISVRELLDGWNIT